MDLRCMLRQDMANAHDRKVGVLLCALLGLTHSNDWSSTYSASWISRHRLILDLLSTLISRRRLIRQLDSSCSTWGRQDKSQMSTYSDLLSTYVDLFQEVRIPTFLSRGRIDLRCMWRHLRCMLRQDMATAHDRKVGILLCAFLGLTCLRLTQQHPE